MPLDAMPSASHATRLAGPLAGVGPSAAAVAESVAADPAPASETIPTLPVVFKDRSTLIENILCKWMQPRLQRILRVFVSVNLAPSTTEDIDEAVLAVLRDGIPVEQDAPLEAVVEEFALLVLAFHLPMLPRTFNLSNVEQINRKLHGGSETDQAHAERGWTFPLHANSCTWLAELPSFHQWTSDYDTPPEDLQSSFSDLDPNSGMDASIQASSGAMSPPAFLALVLDESYKAIFPQSNASGVSCDIDPDNVAAWDALASLTCFSRDCVEQFGLNKAFESNDSFTPLDRALAIIHMLQNMKPPATFSERAVLAVSSVRDYILHESVHYQFFSNPHIPYTYTIGVLVSIDSLFDPAGDSPQDLKRMSAVARLMNQLPNRNMTAKALTKKLAPILRVRRGANADSPKGARPPGSMEVAISMKADSMIMDADESAQVGSSSGPLAEVDEQSATGRSEEKVMPRVGYAQMPEERSAPLALNRPEQVSSLSTSLTVRQDGSDATSQIHSEQSFAAPVQTTVNNVEGEKRTPHPDRVRPSQFPAESLPAIMQTIRTRINSAFNARFDTESLDSTWLPPSSSATGISSPPTPPPPPPNAPPRARQVPPNLKIGLPDGLQAQPTPSVPVILPPLSAPLDFLHNSQVPLGSASAMVSSLSLPLQRATGTGNVGSGGEGLDLETLSILDWLGGAVPPLPQSMAASQTQQGYLPPHSSLRLQGGFLQNRQNVNNGQAFIPTPQQPTLSTQHMLRKVTQLSLSLQSMAGQMQSPATNAPHPLPGQHGHPIQQIVDGLPPQQQGMQISSHHPADVNLAMQWHVQQQQEQQKHYLHVDRQQQQQQKHYLQVDRQQQQQQHLAPGQILGTYQQPLAQTEMRCTSQQQQMSNWIQIQHHLSGNAGQFMQQRPGSLDGGMTVSTTPQYQTQRQYQNQEQPTANLSQQPQSQQIFHFAQFGRLSSLTAQELHAIAPPVAPAGSEVAEFLEYSFKSQLNFLIGYGHLQLEMRQQIDSGQPLQPYLQIKIEKLQRIFSALHKLKPKYFSRLVASLPPSSHAVALVTLENRSSSVASATQPPQQRNEQQQQEFLPSGSVRTVGTAAASQKRSMSPIDLTKSPTEQSPVSIMQARREPPALDVSCERQFLDGAPEPHTKPQLAKQTDVPNPVMPPRMSQPPHVSHLRSLPTSAMSQAPAQPAPHPQAQLATSAPANLFAGISNTPTASQHLTACKPVTAPIITDSSTIPSTTLQPSTSVASQVHILSKPTSVSAPRVPAISAPVEPYQAPNPTAVAASNQAPVATTPFGGATAWKPGAGINNLRPPASGQQPMSVKPPNPLLGKRTSVSVPNSGPLGAALSTAPPHSKHPPTQTRTPLMHPLPSAPAPHVARLPVRRPPAHPPTEPARSQLSALAGTQSQLPVRAPRVFPVGNPAHLQATSHALPVAEPLVPLKRPSSEPQQERPNKATHMGTNAAPSVPALAPPPQQPSASTPMLDISDQSLHFRAADYGVKKDDLVNRVRAFLPKFTAAHTFDALVAAGTLEVMENGDVVLPRGFAGFGPEEKEEKKAFWCFMKEGKKA